MQIQNNYNNYSGTEYHRSHTHHITECLYDHEDAPKSESGASRGKGSSPVQEETVKSEKEQLLFYEHNSGMRKQETGLKKGVGLLRRVWDSMGEESRDTGGIAQAMNESQTGENTAGGIWAASSAIRNLIPFYVTEKWDEVKDRVRESAGAAFQRFNKRKDAFLALSDPGRRSMAKKEEGQRRKEKAGKGTRRKKPEILTATMSDTHLTDSYSKTGEYCKLNDNLTYRREQRLEANRRAFSERTDAGTEKEPSKVLADNAKRVDKRL